MALHRAADSFPDTTVFALQSSRLATVNGSRVANGFTVDFEVHVHASVVKVALENTLTRISKE
jgi:hypothetical protein